VQKSNSHYALQPNTNQSVFKSLLNCTSEISLSRNVTGREFQWQVLFAYRVRCWRSCKERDIVPRYNENPASIEEQQILKPGVHITW